MALLNKDLFQVVEKEKNSIHEETHATYTVFSKEGRTLFQIDTFGSSEREIPGKVSQSIQIDKEMAEVLIAKLRGIFKLD